MQEVDALEDVCPSVAHDLDQQFVALEMVPFPAGWHPDTGAIVYDLPDTYPQEQPDAYLPDNMRFEGERPLIMLRAGPPGWSKHCIHNFRDKWVPEYHSLLTMTRMIKESLKHPNESNPWKAAHQHSH
jgi:hypothetical protein